jgi:preprotein translocase subunit SecG
VDRVGFSNLGEFVSRGDVFSPKLVAGGVGEQGAAIVVRPGSPGSGPERSTVVPFLVVIHVLVSVGLLVLVLLHSGKGGGLSDMFGGGMGAAAQGSTVVEKNLDRITVGFAVVFGFTSLGLGLLMSTPT